MGNGTDRIIAIDIFCGAGGFTLAAKQLKIDVIAAIEYDKYACETYRNNFIKYKHQKPLLYESDVLDISPDKLLSDLKIAPGRLDILMGGPPCQGFSTHRIKNAGVNDPRNQLLTRYFDFVRVLKPKTFIVENVSGLLWDRHKKHLKKFYRLARDSGYDVFEPAVLNAKNFGVPQNRKRVFILGKRKDLNLEINWPPSPTHFAPESKEVKEKGKPHWLPALMVFEKSLKRDDPNNIHMNHSKELFKVFKSTPKNGGSRSQSKRQLPCHKNHNGHKDVYGRIDPKKPGPTITTGCVNPSKGRFLHPTKNHGITVRHAARFQSFPDDFIFSGGLMASSVQVGNAVPINLGIKTIGIIASPLRGI
ncbi:MAG: DNA cytosine methyltransferase [Sedimentisphaerales bacterium]|nr:DNA cytosine methyltransferase [Sedimentisphaerales bacterium]